MSDDDRKGFWYWMVLTKPSNYFLAKAIGGEAEKQAEAAMEDVAPAIVVIAVVIAFGLIIFGLGRVFALW